MVVALDSVRREAVLIRVAVVLVHVAAALIRVAIACQPAMIQGRGAASMQAWEFREQKWSLMARSHEDRFRLGQRELHWQSRNP